MLTAYGMSIAGTSHIEKNIPCQDSHRYELLTNGWFAVAVADGVGSAKHSEVASKIACDTFIEMCKTCITRETKKTEIKDIIKKAYIAADYQIKDYVYKIDDIITDYDTTLSAVIFDGKHVTYGHSGDGGIVVLTTSGDYIKVTKPQKADDGICVIPLRAGETYWEFGECEAEAASVLLATDGVYDSFMPYLLRGQPVEFYIPLIRWFMDNNIIGITENNCKKIEEYRKSFLCSDSCKAITDDKTIAVAFNTDIMPELKDESYYAEPDWAKLQESWNKKAYPHLYKDRATDKNEEQVSDEQTEPKQEDFTDETQASSSVQLNTNNTQTADESAEIVSESELQTATTATADKKNESAEPSDKKNSILGLFKKKKN